jgi:hypothetical protein
MRRGRAADLRDADFPDGTAGNGHGLLWPLRIDRRAGHTLTLTTAINCIGIGFLRGTHTRWQLVTNDGTGAPTLTDMGGSFPITTGGVLTLFIAAPPNGSSIWLRVVDEVSEAVFEQEITADLPANTQFLSPRLFTNNGATAAAVACDCSGDYLETSF